MFRSTIIVRELVNEHALSYIDIKTFSKVTSLFVMQWCGSMSRYGVRIVLNLFSSLPQAYFVSAFCILFQFRRSP